MVLTSIVVMPVNEPILLQVMVSLMMAVMILSIPYE